MLSHKVSVGEVIDFAPKTTGLLPHNMEVEESVLGCVLSDPIAIARTEEVGLKPEHFYNSGNRAIYECALHIYNRGFEPTDMSVAARLSDIGLLGDVGGIGRIQDLSRRSLTSANVDACACVVVEKAKRRSLISSARKIEQAALDSSRDIAEVIDESEKAVYEAVTSTDESKTISMSEAFNSVLDSALDRYGSKELPGISSGFASLDKTTQGFQRGELTVLAARPAMGKSGLAVQIGSAIARSENQPAVFFSLEMTAEVIGTRMLSATVSISASKIRAGELQPEDWPILAEASEEMGKLPFFIEPTRGATINMIRSKARRLSAIHGGISVIVVDYLQIMGGADNDRVNSLGRIVRSLRNLAGELDCPIILLSQLSRGLESRNDKRPIPSDLRDSGEIEQEADLILMLYRDEYYNTDTPDRGIAEVIAVKNRNGPTGTVKLLFEGEFVRFSDAPVLNPKGNF